MMSTKVLKGDPGPAITVSRPTLASCPLTKVPAPPRGRTRHARRNDPGLQPVDLLRRHAEEQEIHIIPIKTAVVVHQTRIARKNGAGRPPPCRVLGRRNVKINARRGATARARRKRPGTCSCKSFHNLPRQHLVRGAKIAGRRTDLLLNKTAVTERPTRIARITGTRWTSFCMHLGLVSPRKKHTKMTPRRLINCENVAEDNGV